MRIRVRLFSVYRERAGVADAEVELPPGSTLAACVAELGRRFPRLDAAPGDSSCLLSLNREYATPEQPLQDGDEVALMPPVSGGATSQGMGDKGLLLLSGGFDSPVAGHLTVANGKRLEAVHFTMEPFTDDASARKAQVLAAQLGLPRLTIVPLGDELAQLARGCEHRLYFVLLKRLMMRVAERLAARDEASFLVTGENLGQVSSQTVPNLGVIDAATRLPILRPLLGMDKQEILQHARRIGTYETSVGPEICDTLGPKHPSTAATLSRVESEEARVNVDALVDHAMSKAFSVVLPAKFEAKPSVPAGGPG